MALKRDFLEEPAETDKLGFLDGFRFGLGFFVASALGLALVSIVASMVLSVVRL